MDRKEAIETLREIKGYYTMDRDFSYYGDEYNGLTDEDNTALDMAIEALQKYDECVEAIKEMLELKAEPKCKQCLYNPEHPFTVNCSEFPTGSDLISRKHAILAVKEYLRDNYIEDADWHGDGIERELYALPSAEPRKGKWINRSLNICYPEWERYTCSVCGKHSYCYDFCPNCGADMREKAGEENV